jgi:hypothetical protein
VFFSHQWTSFSHPDPGNIQWAMMIKVARQLGRKVGKDDAAVWGSGSTMRASRRRMPACRRSRSRLCPFTQESRALSWSWLRRCHTAILKVSLATSIRICRGLGVGWSSLRMRAGRTQA